MECKVMKCPYCGGKISGVCAGTTTICEYCGHTLVFDQENGNFGTVDSTKASLIIEYDAGSGTAPEMNVMISKKEDGELRKALFGQARNDKGEVKSHRIPNMRKLKVILDKGEYNVLFKINIYKKKMVIDLDEDKILKVTWHRISGKVDYEYVSEEDCLI